MADLFGIQTYEQTRRCDPLDGPRSGARSGAARRAGLERDALRTMGHDEARQALNPEVASGALKPKQAGPGHDVSEPMSLLSVASGADNLQSAMRGMKPSMLGRTGPALGALNAVHCSAKAVEAYRRPGGTDDGVQHTADAVMSGLGATKNPVLGALSTGYGVGQLLDKASGAKGQELTGISGNLARGMAATDVGLKLRGLAHEAGAPARHQQRRKGLLEQEISGQERALERASADTARARIQQNLDRLRAELAEVDATGAP